MFGFQIPTVEHKIDLYYPGVQIKLPPQLYIVQRNPNNSSGVDFITLISKVERRTHTGVDFIKFEPTAQIIEIALSFYVTSFSSISYLRNSHKVAK